jgi:flagellar biosynthesis protein FlhA
MVLDPGGGEPNIEGIAMPEPAFGLPARWVTDAVRREAEQRGLTVVDAASTITTHLGEVLRRNAAEMIGRQEVQELLGLLAKDAPKLVEDVVPGTVGLGEVVAVTKGLLREGVSIRDLRTVLEAIAAAAPKSKDPVYLIEQVRRRMARHITARISDARGVARAITLDRGAEQVLRASLGVSEGEPMLALDIDCARRLIERLEGHAARLLAGGVPVVVLAPPDLRRAFYDFASRFIPDLWVVSARELTATTTIEPAGVLQLQAGAATP